MEDTIKHLETTEFVLRDAYGFVKPIWNENFLGRFFRQLGFNIRVPLVTGLAKESLIQHNTITNVGHAAANGRISNQGSYSPFVNIAIGVGVQGSPATSTALASESTTVGSARSAAAATQKTTTVTNDTTQLVKTFTFSGSLAITEEGIFDSATASSGTMLAYQSFAAINVVSTDTITVTHSYQT